MESTNSYSDLVDSASVQDAVSRPVTLFSLRSPFVPVLHGDRVMLREVELSDASSLFALLTTTEVRRFINVPPASVDGFERFIVGAQEQRRAGLGICFAVVLKGFDTAIGIVQVRASQSASSTAEWGFAVGSPFWGTGVFCEAAELVLRFVFETLGIRRLEATAAVRNGRGNRVLQKLGAIQEGVLRETLACHGEYVDEAVYAILEKDWRRSRGYGRSNRISIH